MAKRARRAHINREGVEKLIEIWASPKLSIDEKLKKTFGTLPKAVQKRLLAQLRRDLKK